MKRICAIIIVTILLGVSFLSMTHIENNERLEKSLSLSTSGSQNNTESLYLDLTSWHLSEGDYIHYSNYGDDYFQLLNNSGHSPELTSSSLQANVLEDRPCNFGGTDALCHVISHTARGNITWYEVDNHHDGHDDHGDNDDHDDHDDETLTPETVLELFDTNNDGNLSWEEFWDSWEDSQEGEDGQEEMSALMEIFNESDINIDELLDINELEGFIDKVGEFEEMGDDHDGDASENGEDEGYSVMIIDTIEWNQTTQIYTDFSASRVDLTQKFSIWEFDLDTGDLLNESIYWVNETHLSFFTGIPEYITVGSQWIEEIESTIYVSYQDNHGHSNSDTWQQLDNISYILAEDLEIELPPNQATNSQKNVSMNLFAIEVDDGENIVTQVANEFFKYKYFNFELTQHKTANQQNQAGGQDGEHNDDDHGDHDHHSHVNYYSYTDLVVDSWHISAYIPDDDGDGLNNSVDQCPDGQSDWISDSETDFDGDGCRDIDEDDDDDNDGFLDIRENECLSDPLNSTSIPLDNDGTGECDALDDDDDDDGTRDVDDAFPFDSSESKDNDADGIGDNADFDDDNDSFLDSEEIQCLSDPYDELSIPNDLDQDLLCDILDSDDDGDSYSDAFEAECESDSMNATSVPKDTDYDGNCNFLDNDDDNDGWPDLTEISCLSDQLNSQSIPTDLDEDGVCDELDTDLDGDGVNNSEDSFPLDPNKSSDSVAGEQDDSSVITYAVAVAVIFGLLVVILTLRRRDPSEGYENEMTQVRVEQEYDQFVDENGTHWLRKSDGNLLWWNGSEWIEYSR